MAEPLIDEFYGVGGSYLLNPKTGKRTLVERTKDSNDTVIQPTTEASTDAVAVTSPDDSGKD